MIIKARGISTTALDKLNRFIVSEEGQLNRYFNWPGYDIDNDEYQLVSLIKSCSDPERIEGKTTFSVTIEILDRLEKDDSEVVNTPQEVLLKVMDILELFPAPKCKKCGGTGVWETGNNDLPCDECPAGDTALFNVTGIDHPINGEEYKKRLR